MQGKWNDRKAIKRRIEGMESEAEYIRRLEKILSGYTEEELEVWEYVYLMKSDQMIHLTCYHPSSEQYSWKRLFKAHDLMLRRVSIISNSYRE